LAGFSPLRLREGPGERLTPQRVGPKTLANLQPTRVGKRGARGAKPPGGGYGGCPPTKPKKGRAANSRHPATSGAQNAGKSLANGGGKLGVEGAQAPWQGVWGMCPQNFQRRGEQLTLVTPPRVGPKTLANSQPTRVGKLGVQGAKPPWQGRGGCPPQNQKGASSHPLQPRPRVGPKTLVNPKPTRVGKSFPPQS